MNQPSFKTVLAEGEYLRLVRKDRWEYVERVNVSGVVAIVALTRKQEIVLVEQFRPAVNARVLELPAGLAGDTGPESLEKAARRELEEETGFTAKKFVDLGAFVPSAGLTSETVRFFRARGAKRTGEGGGDANEDIEVHVVPVADAAKFVRKRAKDGAAVDDKVMAGLFFAQS